MTSFRSTNQSRHANTTFYCGVPRYYSSTRTDACPTVLAIQGHGRRQNIQTTRKSSNGLSKMQFVLLKKPHANKQELKCVLPFFTLV